MFAVILFFFIPEGKIKNNCRVHILSDTNMKSKGFDFAPLLRHPLSGQTQQGI